MFFGHDDFVSYSLQGQCVEQCPEYLSDGVILDDMVLTRTSLKLVRNMIGVGFFPSTMG